MHTETHIYRIHIQNRHTTQTRRHTLTEYIHTYRFRVNVLRTHTHTYTLSSQTPAHMTDSLSFMYRCLFIRGTVKIIKKAAGKDDIKTACVNENT